MLYYMSTVYNSKINVKQKKVFFHKNNLTLFIIFDVSETRPFTDDIV